MGALPARPESTRKVHARKARDLETLLHRPLREIGPGFDSRRLHQIPFKRLQRLATKPRWAWLCGVFCCDLSDAPLQHRSTGFLGGAAEHPQGNCWRMARKCAANWSARHADRICRPPPCRATSFCTGRNVVEPPSVKQSPYNSTARERGVEASGSRLLQNLWRTPTAAPSMAF
jgi:hypothetical protein